MLELYFLIFITTGTSYLVSLRMKQCAENNIINTQKKDILTIILVVFMTTILILFSGLRTKYNDTGTYMYAFQLLDTDLNFSSLFESYGGFDIYQKIIKKYISDNPQMMILITAVITNLAYLHFYKKYSASFGYTIFLYLILGIFTFSMAGIKQILAMSISLFAIDNLLSKKYIKFSLWLILASTFHPYILIMFLLALFTNNIWDKRSVILIVFVILFAFFFDLLLGTVIEIAGEIGKDYTAEELTSHTINIFRVLIEIIPCVLTYVFREKIKAENSKLLNLAVNMLLIKTLMYILSMFVNPIYFGRIGTYFDSLDPILIAWMLTTCLPKNKNGTLWRIAYCSFYLLYFTLDMTKLNLSNISYDFFSHTSLTNIF